MFLGHMTRPYDCLISMKANPTKVIILRECRRFSLYYGLWTMAMYSPVLMRPTLELGKLKQMRKLVIFQKEKNKRLYIEINWSISSNILTILRE